MSLAFANIVARHDLRSHMTVCLACDYETEEAGCPVGQALLDRVALLEAASGPEAEYHLLESHL